MSDIKYAVSVIVDGHHVVNVESDDPIITSRVVESLGQTFRLSPTHRRADEPGAPALQQATAPLQAAEPNRAAVPICAIHHNPMKRMNGRRGEFWSCHEKMGDGSWCSYKPGPQR